MKAIWFVLACLILFVAPEAGAAGLQTSYDLGRNIEQLLVSGQFDRLESMAAEFRHGGPKFPGGEPPLYTFYDALGAIRGYCDCGDSTTALPFDTKKDAIAKWMKAFPRSTAARVAMAQLWINDADVARGDAYGGPVSGERGKDYRDRLKIAESYLEGLDPQSNLFIYFERSEAAPGSPSPRQALDAAFAAATHADPAWFPMYVRQAAMLQDKWYGRPGELARFTQSLLTTPGGEIGQVAYVDVATRFADSYAAYHLFQMVGLEWPQLQQAYFVKQDRYGFSEADWGGLLTYSDVAVAPAFAEKFVPSILAHAEKGSKPDQKNLGWAYLQGVGVPWDRSQALRWYRLAAADGDAVALYQIGWIYEHATPPDFGQALSWYRRSSAQGYPVAKNNMAYMYETGQGVPFNINAAAKLFREAAEDGSSRAAFHLGAMYAVGLGVPKNEDEAVAWMRKAAYSGEAEAQEWLDRRRH